MEIFGNKTLFRSIKIFFDILYYSLLILSVIVLVFFLIKILNPSTNILDFSFHKETSLSDIISKNDYDIDIPEIFGMKISNFKATTRFNINDRQRIFLALFSFTYALGLITSIFYNFRKLFSNFYKHHIFNAENAKRISYIGCLLVISEVISFVLSFIFELYEISIRFFNLKITASYEYNLTMLFIGLGLIILGEVFKYGVNLEEEQKLTI